MKQTIYVDLNHLGEKAGGLITRLIQGYGNSRIFRNPMTDSIQFGYVDMMDMLIE